GPLGWNAASAGRNGMRRTGLPDQSQITSQTTRTLCRKVGRARCPPHRSALSCSVLAVGHGLAGLEDLGTAALEHGIDTVGLRLHVLVRLVHLVFFVLVVVLLGHGV